MEKKLSIAEPVSQLRHVPIRECGEELVEFTGHPRIFIDRPRFNYHRETLARQSVVEFLHRAADGLPPGYKLGVIEGWRAPMIQRKMYQTIYRRFQKQYPDWSPQRLTRLTNQFTAPMNDRVPPPHTTGGAVDLVLADENGKVLDHTSPFDRNDHRCFPFAVEGLTPEARRHRDILAEAFASGGMTNYPSEYWHWTYGDQGWAYRGRHPHALYGPITPPNWQPHPDDVGEHELIFYADEP